MKSSLYLIGTNFKQAPLDRVARVQWSDKSQISPFLARARAALQFDEIFFLQTCNRREFYIYSTRPIDDSVDFLNLLNEDLGENLQVEDFYCKHGFAAARHAFRVASSLDSMVLGETEIMKQIKDQSAAATRHKHMARRLKALMETALWAAKQVRTRTHITRNVVSMASLAYRGVMEHTRCGSKRVVFVGAGHFIQSILPTFTKSPELELIFVNRTLPKALAEQYGGTAITLADFQANPVPFDAMVTATGSSRPLFDAAFMRDRGNVLLMDAGLPRDIDRDVRDLPNTIYMDLGEMEAVLAANRAAREAEIPKTEPIFDEGLERLHQLWLECDLSVYSREISSHYRETGERALARLIKTELPDLSQAEQEMLRGWTNSLVGKLTTIPILGLKGVARDLGTPAVQSFTRQVAEKAPLFRD
ncbi:MAG: hypothetical protein QNK37_04435 [Acidobacteriota bacterium]|nr:hypothetical protein [Acidobacteriota bacterium]